jgi:hypothetical protein
LNNNKSFNSTMSSFPVFGSLMRGTWWRGT